MPHDLSFWMRILAWYGLPSYLVGSIPYGFIFGRLKGIDLRLQGSGNIGATNVWRVLGKGWGLVTFALDFAKAPLAACLVLHWNPWGWGEAPKEEMMMLIRLIIFSAAILGHNYPIWLGFRGGKGIATSAGGLLWLMPTAFAVMGGIWILIFALFRYVSLASILAALSLPMTTFIFYRNSLLFVGFSFFLSIMAVWRHRSNIQRLLSGTEHQWKGKDVQKAKSNRGGIM